MSTLINLRESLPAATDIIALCFEYVDCILDQALFQFESFKKQFLLELRLMEAIEHEYFKDLNNMQQIEAVNCHQEIENPDIIAEENRWNVTKEEGQMQLGKLRANEHESRFAHTDDPRQQKITRLLQNMKIEHDADIGKGDMEAKLVEQLSSLKLETPGGDNSEAILTELLSSFKLKAPEDGLKKDEPSKDNLAMDAMATVLAKLSLGEDPLDTFDRDLAVFDHDGNIMVQDSSIFTFLAKVLLSQNSERELLRRLLFPNQNE